MAINHFWYGVYNFYEEQSTKQSERTMFFERVLDWFFKPHWWHPLFYLLYDFFASSVGL